MTGDSDTTKESRKLPDPEAINAKLPAVVESGTLSIPSSADLQAILQSVEQIDEMRTFHEASAAWEATMRRMRKAQEEVAAIAEFRIRLERKIGHYLAQTVRRGRPMKRLAGQTLADTPHQSRLPDHISKRMASDYRRLAAIPEDKLHAYLQWARATRRAPSSKGLLRFAGVSTVTRSMPTRSCVIATVQPDLPERAAWLTKRVLHEVVQAVQRFMDVTVQVGGDKSFFPHSQWIAPDLLQGRHIRENMIIVECPDPESWLPKLAAARTAGQVAQVVALVPADTGKKWFKSIEAGKWLCCFPTGSAAALIYCGERKHGFWTLFQSIGTVLAPQEGN